MKELIKITEYKNRKIVNARELHRFLGSKQQFGNWIENRIKKYGFELNKDYVIAYYDYKGNFLGDSLNKNIKTDSQVHTKDYGLTIDTAKEIAMVENNARGRQARRYFIEVEKQWQQGVAIDTDQITRKELASMVIQSEEEKEKYKKELEQAKPKAEFADQITETDNLIDLGQAAKTLGLPFGRNKFMKQLRADGIFFKNKNEPKQYYIDKDYFRLKEKLIQRDNHENFTVLKVLVTQKGLKFLHKNYGQQSQLNLAPII